MVQSQKKSPGLLTETKILLRRHKLRQKKRYGQNFLVDDFVQRNILDTASLKRDETVLEIGAGLGALTLPMAKRAKEVIALEFDRKCCDILNDLLRDYKNVRVIKEDALRFDYDSIKEPYKVVANLPYYISTPLLIKLLGYRKRITEMILMFQKEIADRITASCGTRDYGLLSVMVQYYTDASLCFTVSKESFMPSPKVDSAVVRLRFLDSPRVMVRDEALFFGLVKASLAYKRKTLWNNLKRAGSMRLDTGLLNKVLERTGIDPKRRGETLNLEEYAKLTHAIWAQKQ